MLYLSCGCLWTLQFYLNQKCDVDKTVAGFMSPNFSDINLDAIEKTSAIETVEVYYNDLLTLLDKYVDYVKNSKESKKPNYSNSIYFINNEQKVAIEEYLKNKDLDIKIEKARYFTKSLEYHQNYLQKRA